MSTLPDHLTTVIKMSPRHESIRPASQHIDMLDGWRALSIILVMIGHLMPLGLKQFELNATVAAAGMAVFFTLSGFLITRILMDDGNLVRFLVRRISRIVPLAWLGMTLALVVAGGGAERYLGNLLFFANLPPFFLLPAGGHFWSLCVEVQFYAFVALLVALGGRRALALLPLFAFAITTARIATGTHASIVTWFRVDEILAGAIIALVHEGKFGNFPQRLLGRINCLFLVPLLFLSAWSEAGALNYARPYISATMVGASIYSAPSWLLRIARTHPVRYIARISYALYIFHGIFQNSWLGFGETKIIKYAKRPLLLAVTFLCSHVSTFHYERHWIALSRRLTAGAGKRAQDLPLG